jgi:hypothetical protein
MIFLAIAAAGIIGPTWLLVRGFASPAILKVGEGEAWVPFRSQR